MDLTRLGQLGKEGPGLAVRLHQRERPGHTRSERAVGASFDELFKGCKERIIVTTFASNVDRIQQIVNVAASYGRKVAVTGRSMENSMRWPPNWGTPTSPKGSWWTSTTSSPCQGQGVHHHHRQPGRDHVPPSSASTFSTHKQVEIQLGTG